MLLKNEGIMKNLTTKQQSVLDFIISFKRAKLSSPSYRDIAEGLNYKHVNSVFQIVKHLEKTGCLSVEGRRNIEVLVGDEYGEIEESNVYNIPILGSVSAGLPLFTESGAALGYVSSTSYMIENPRDMFFVKVNGDSMINANIQHEDMLLVRKTNIAKHRDIVIALIDQNETTCKRLMLENGRSYLKPENDNYPIIESESLEIQGVVEKLIRNHLD